jgi:hypothetical protein
MYVSNMPSPANIPAVDFRLDVEEQNESRLLHLTKKGGDALHPWSTKIVLMAGDTSEVHELGHGGVVADWDTGEAWVSPLPAGSKETRVLVYETEKGNVIWDGLVSADGALARLQPFFAAKGFSVVPAHEGQANTICAKLVDPSQRLDHDSVRCDGRALGLPEAMVMSDPDMDGVFETVVLTPSMEWNGAVCWFNATDMDGGSIGDSVTLEVQPSTEATPPPGNLYRNGDHLVGLFDSNEWLARGFAAHPREDFDQDDSATLVLASRSLMDPSDLNSLRLVSSKDGKENRSLDGLSDGMTPSGFRDGYYLFTCTFLVGDVADNVGPYRLVGLLRDQFADQTQASFSLPLAVGGQPNPRMSVARDVGAEETTWVLAGDEIALNIEFPARMTPRSPKAELLIQDLDGQVYLRCDPFTASYCHCVGASEKETNFLLDLSAGACKAWRPGNNTYIVLLEGLKGTDGQISLCRPLKVSASPYAIDLLVGGDPLLEHTPQGVPVLLLMQGSGRLQVPLELKRSSLTDDRCYEDGVLADLDGDGVPDAAAIMGDYEKNRYLDNHFLLLCLSTEGFQPRILCSLGPSLFPTTMKDAPRPSVEAFDADGDGDNEIAVQVGKVVSILWNDGHWTKEKVFTFLDYRYPCEMRSMSLGDIDGDGYAEQGLAIAHERGITILVPAAPSWVSRTWLPSLYGYEVRDICVKPGAYQGHDMIFALTDWEVFAGYYRHDLSAGLVTPCPVFTFENRMESKELDAGDVDGDGALEIITLGLKVGRSVLTCLDNGPDGYFEAGSITMEPAQCLTALELADVQEDGRAELLVGGVDGRLHLMGGSGPASAWFDVSSLRLLQTTSCAVRFLWAA